MQKFIILLACVAFVSCKSNKSVTEYKETLRIDTIKSEKIIEKFRAVHDTLVIKNPCDSAGLLSTFYSRLVLPNGSVTIKSDQGQIRATVAIDSMRWQTENNYRNSRIKVIEYRDKEVIKYRVPTWVIILLFAQAIMLLGYLYYKLVLR
jgi:hypothetical protein